MSSDRAKKPGAKASQKPGYEVDEAGLNEYIEQRRSQQNLVAGILAGLAGAAIGSIVWAVSAVVSEKEYAVVAVVVGFLVGCGVRFFGKGIETRFGVAGAILAVIGVVVGKMIATAIVASNTDKSPLTQLIDNFHPIDLVFYAVALFQGYRFSFHKITKDEMKAYVRLVRIGEERTER